MYVSPNFKTKKALKEAVAKGETVYLWKPSPISCDPTDGVVAVEGPHHPKPHRWYAQVTLARGRVTLVN